MEMISCDMLLYEEGYYQYIQIQLSKWILHACMNIQIYERTNTVVGVCMNIQIHKYSVEMDIVSACAIIYQV